MYCRMKGMLLEGTNEEIGKLISIFLREQKEEVHRVFVLKYFISNLTGLLQKNMVLLNAK